MEALDVWQVLGRWQQAARDLKSLRAAGSRILLSSCIRAGVLWRLEAFPRLSWDKGIQNRFCSHTLPSAHVSLTVFPFAGSIYPRWPRESTELTSGSEKYHALVCLKQVPSRASSIKEHCTVEISITRHEYLSSICIVTSRYRDKLGRPCP